jgi:hypothetical protein
MNTDNEYQSHDEVERRRDEALRPALSTPPKQHKDIKMGKARKRTDEHPTAFER